MTGLWSKYRTQILAAIIGALLSGVISLAVGLYSITKSFQYLQNKELLQQLRADITLLKSVESELDLNLQSLLSEPVSLTIETEPVGAWRDFVQAQADTTEKGPPDEKFLAILDAMMGGDVHRVTKAEIPRQFYVETWPPGGPGVSEINFALIQEINDLYRDLRRLNGFIERLRNITAGRAVTEHIAEYLRLEAATYESLVARISGDSILGAKNRISAEIVRLNDRRRRLAD